MLSFSYGGEHVSNDVVIAVLERIIQCVERVAAVGEGDWERRLSWLNVVNDNYTSHPAPIRSSLII